MTDREKLIELLTDCDCPYPWKSADYLIENGVEVAPVVHCRQCTHLRSGKNNFGVFLWCGNAAGLTNIYDPDTDYCPRGTRMDG